MSESIMIVNVQCDAVSIGILNDEGQRECIQLRSVRTFNHFDLHPLTMMHLVWFQIFDPNQVQFPLVL